MRKIQHPLSSIKRFMPGGYQVDVVFNDDVTISVDYVSLDHAEGVATLFIENLENLNEDVRQNTTSGIEQC